MCEATGKPSLPEDALLKHKLTVWKTAIETQMHFNDLLIRMRTTVISIILAVFGAAAIALKDMKWYANI